MSFLIPAGELAQLARLGKLAQLFRLRRGLQLLDGFGSDAAITKNLANLIPKRGWYDVVVHGTEDGLGFVVDGQRITPEQLYGKMLEEGYAQGTKVRLMSCYGGSVEGGAAAQLSKLTESMVVASKSWVTVVSDGSIWVPQGFSLFK